MRFEINGTRRILAFDFENMNVLEHYDGRRPAAEAGFTRILVTEPSHPYLSSWWPPGHGLGYEHGFTHQVIDLVRAIASGDPARPTFADGLHVQRVLAAIEDKFRRRQQLAVHPRRGALTWPARSPCSPANGPTCRSRRWPGSPPSGAMRVWRSPAGEIISTSGGARKTTTTSPAARRSSTGTGCPVFAISNHLKGQAVCDDPIDARHRDILPDRIWGDGDPEGVRQRAAEEMKMTARTAARLGVDTVVGFTGSSVWKYVAMFPPASQALIDAGYQDFADRWNPILDVFDEVGVRFAHEVHPSEIAYDYYTTERTLEAIGHRPAFGLNWDPSHFVWQGLDPVMFLWDFRDRIYHVDCKDAKLRTGNGRRGRARLAPAVGGSAPRLGLRLHRTRRRALGGLLPDAEHHRLHRSAVHRMGGRRDGPVGRRARGAGVRKSLAFAPPSAAFDAAFSSQG